MTRPPALPPVITIFGGSDVRPGQPAWREAFEFSRIMAATARIYCGGYGGVMDAVARGAKAGGGGAHGILCTGLEWGNRPSPALASNETARDLYDRLRRLIEPARVYVAFDGSCGTLNEIAMLLGFYRSGQKLGRPLILVGKRNHALAAALKGAGYLPASARPAVKIALNAASAVRIARKILKTAR